MRKHYNRMGRLLALALFALIANPAHAYDYPDVYDPLQLITLNLDMDPADWSTVKGDTTYDIELPAMFWADGETPILVSVRRKSAEALGDKVSLKIDINEYNGDDPRAVSKWSRLKKLSLENGDDVDVVAEGLAWYLNRVAASASSSGYTPGLAAWVKLYVNGEYLGVYLNVEQPDKQFLKNRGIYDKGETWLYKAGETFDLKVGDPDSPTTAALCYSPFGDEGSPGKGGKGKKGGGGGSTGCTAPDSDSAMASELNKLIDMEAMLTQGAVSAFTMGPDALFSTGKNFYYIDFGGDKRQYIPWYLDTVFISDDPTGSIYGTERKRRGTTELSQSAYEELILNNPTFRTQYDRIMADLLNGPLQVDDQIAFLNALEVLLTPALQADANKNFAGSTVPERFDSLRQWVNGRVININEQLSH